MQEPADQPIAEPHQDRPVTLPGSMASFGVTALILAILPAIVFMASALYRDMGFDGGFNALAGQYVADRNNLAVVTLLGFFPLLLVLCLLGIRRLIRKTWRGGAVYVQGSAIPIVAVALFVNMEFWPKFLPAQRSPGFPHGLEFVIGPLIFAPIGVLLAFGLIWLLRRGQK